MIRAGSHEPNYAVKHTDMTRINIGKTFRAFTCRALTCSKLTFINVLAGAPGINLTDPRADKLIGHTVGSFHA